MRVAAFLSVRRAYGLVRQQTEAPSRISFEELSALCRLRMADRPVRTSDLAHWQRVLRPTMTHRANHLATLGLIERGVGSDDRRSVCCSLSGDGAKRLEQDCAAICDRIGAGMPLSRCAPGRMVAVVSAMGQVAVDSADLVVLGLLELGGASAFCSPRSPCRSRRSSMPGSRARTPAGGGRSGSPRRVAPMPARSPAASRPWSCAAFAREASISGETLPKPGSRPNASRAWARIKTRRSESDHYYGKGPT